MRYISIPWLEHPGSSINIQCSEFVCFEILRDGLIYILNLVVNVLSSYFKEHTVYTVVKLLSPPLPSNAPATGEANHFLDHMHMLTATLSSLCHTDIVHILWLHGVARLLSHFLSNYFIRINIGKK